MIKFIKRLLGWECCGPWSQWERKEEEYIKYRRSLDQIIVAGGENSYRVTEAWQERRCMKCGKIQQQRLDY
jgi:hypothetical protein